MMKRHSRGNVEQPTMMIHHIREIQLRLLSVAVVLVAGMVVGYIFYEPLFEFIKAPLNGPLHYMSPAGSFTFIIKICMMVGVIAALPIAIYNVIMFAQPALSARLSRARVYLTTLASLLLAGAGAAFGFFVILPLALRFFYKFQVDGLEAIISADEYFRFVIGVILTFVLIFQLPLLISCVDHIKPLPPKKLLKAEKYIIVGSVFIGVAVPFALNPMVQLLIASPIILLYNISIGIVAWQHLARTRRSKRADKRAAVVSQKQAADDARPVIIVPSEQPVTPVAVVPPVTVSRPVVRAKKSLDGTFSAKAKHAPLPKSARRSVISSANPSLPDQPSSQLLRPRRLVMDMHPTPIRSRSSPSSRPLTLPSTDSSPIAS